MWTFPSIHELSRRTLHLYQFGYYAVRCGDLLILRKPPVNARRSPVGYHRVTNSPSDVSDAGGGDLTGRAP